MNWGDKIERICAVLVCILTSVCILPVWAVSIVWTQSFWNETSQEYTDVFMFRIRDGIKFNLLFCIVALFLFTMICVGARRMKQWQITALIALEAVAVVIFCGVYNWQLRPIQWADYSQIVSIAGAFVRGDFSQFTPGAYLATYPHQLGLICLVMGIIKLVGGANAIPTFQILNCFCAGGILVFGYRIVHCIWQRKEIDLIYGLIQGMCLPLYFYTGLVYGEIISIMLLLVGMEQMVRMCCQKRVTWQRAGVMLLSLGLAVAFRKNSLVVFIAMGIVLLIVMLKEKYWKLMLLYLVLFGGVIVPLVLRKGVFGAFPDEGAMPTAIWIYIGMGEGGGFGYGAYDGKAAKIMEEADYDTERANDIVMELIGDKMSYFRQNPQQAALFYREKVLWQWTDPSFHCFTYTRLTEKGYPVGLAYDIVKGKVRAGIFDFMDAYQSFVYLLSVIGVLGIVRRRETIVNLLWAVILLGGFFFHILWEADSRYIYPYFVLMLPMCAYGVCSMSDAALRIAERMRNYVKIKMKQDV